MKKKITFRFGPGDEVFVMMDNKITKGTIHKAEAELLSHKLYITYVILVDNNEITIKRSHEYVFNSSQELKDAL
tara:strand:- start:563 stop:784 length:222 start_codon:yes stop_codon:yes gene_type:complete